MKKPSMDTVLACYRSHRRENFAASQRLEGILVGVTRRNNPDPLPSKEALRKKHADLRG
jgi:hypothetical protein